MKTRAPLLLALLALPSAPALAVGLNDTGQTLCYNEAGGTVACGNDSAAYPRQDGRYGRDAANAAGALTKIGGGEAGFDYTKLGANGLALATQNQAWAFDGSGYDSGSEAAGSQWSCVKDNVSGLVWEVKTHASTPDLRDKDWTYTWYDATASTNGGNAGLPDSGAGVGSDNCFNNARCDTAQYAADVSTAALCAYSDWRLPSLRELNSLTHKGRINPAIEPGYFPNTQILYFWYWSALTSIASTNFAQVVNFNNGSFSSDNKVLNNRVRLVRGGQF
jgi:hypothetical protein